MLPCVCAQLYTADGIYMYNARHTCVSRPCKQPFEVQIFMIFARSDSTAVCVCVCWPSDFVTEIYGFSSSCGGGGTKSAQPIFRVSCRRYTTIAESYTLLTFKLARGNMENYTIKQLMSECHGRLM